MRSLWSAGGPQSSYAAQREKGGREKEKERDREKRERRASLMPLRDSLDWINVSSARPIDRELVGEHTFLTHNEPVSPALGPRTGSGHSGKT